MENIPSSTYGGHWSEHATSTSTKVGSKKPDPDSDSNPIYNIASVIYDLVVSLFSGLFSHLSSDSYSQKQNSDIIRLKRQLAEMEERYQAEKNQNRILGSDLQTMKSLLNAEQSKRNDAEIALLLNVKLIPAH